MDTTAENPLRSNRLAHVLGIATAAEAIEPHMANARVPSLGTFTDLSARPMSARPDWSNIRTVPSSFKLQAPSLKGACTLRSHEVKAVRIPTVYSLTCPLTLTITVTTCMQPFSRDLQLEGCVRR